MNINYLKNSILKELGISDLPTEDQEKVIEGLGENLIRGVILASLSKLNDEDKNELQKRSANGDFKKVYEFLKSKIVNFDELAHTEIKKGIEEFKKIKSDL